MTALDELMERPAADPDVRGAILTGSHARGMATAHSDYDVIVVVDASTNAWRETTRTAAIDEIVYTVAELADTSPTSQRYAFRGADVLLDRLDGGIADLARSQATPTEREVTAWAAKYLDTYINQAYRALKSRRDGRTVEARLDEMGRVAADPVGLFADIEAVARDRGHGAIVDAWGDELALFR